MKKQGPPPSFDDLQRSASKKSKISIEDNIRGKKRKASGEIKEHEPTQKKNTNDVGKTRGFKQNAKSAGRPPQAANGRKSKSEKPNVQLARDEAGEDEGSSDLSEREEETMEGLSSGGSDLDIEALINSDEFPEDDEEGVPGAGDSDSSVFDSDPQEGNGMFSDDEASDAEDRLTAANIEGLSKKLDQKQAEETEQAQLELEEAALQTNIDGDPQRILEDGSDGGEGSMSRLPPDLQLLRSRITDVVRVLDDFAKLAEPNRSRADYTAQLLKDICLYYGYSSYLADKLFRLFTPREAFAFFEANETARPVVIRTNTLKSHRRELAQALINRGVTLEPVGKWSKVGLQIFESQVPLGATPEYLAGHYILQAASSFLPVMALAPQENERILDMAAAPGGKTTYIAALMKNTGSIFANDSNKSRAKGLIGNIHRLGAKNTIVCNYDAKEFPHVIGGFDRVLLDAPCSGTGVIAKDASVKTNKTEKDFMQLPHLQKKLLLSAIDSTHHASKTGGYIVYSTCSVTVEENEQVVQYALSKRPNVKLVETGLTFGLDGFVSYEGKKFDPQMKTTKRYYPHKYNVDGFFVSKFKKIGPSPTPANGSQKSAETNGTSKVEKENLPVGGDKAPISESSTEGIDGDAFGGWDEEEDKAYIERARRRSMKKKGVDPRARTGRTISSTV